MSFLAPSCQSNAPRHENIFPARSDYKMEHAPSEPPRENRGGPFQPPFSIRRFFAGPGGQEQVLKGHEGFFKGSLTKEGGCRGEGQGGQNGAHPDFWHFASRDISQTTNPRLPRT